jgi:hypothetical protein
MGRHADHVQEGDEVTAGSETPHGATQADEATIAAFMAEPYTSPQLIVDGVDYSNGYGKCLAASSYVEPVSVRDPGREAEVKQGVAEASNKWASCARNNGFSAVRDAPTPVIDDYQTYPVVLLPASVTLDQIESLARSCPVLEQTEADRLLEAATAGEAVERDPLPEIGFDVPGFDGQPLRAGAPEQDTTAQQYASLLEVLYKTNSDLNTELERISSGS